MPTLSNDDVIGRNDRPRTERRHAEVRSGAIHCSKIGRDRQVALHPDAADLAGAVVGVEIGGELARAPASASSSSTSAEVLAHVGARAEQALFFAAPERDADRAARPGADRFQDPQRFHHRRAAGRVVGGAGRERMRVEVGAEQHDFAARSLPGISAIVLKPFGVGSS